MRARLHVKLQPLHSPSLHKVGKRRPGGALQLPGLALRETELLGKIAHKGRRCGDVSRVCREFEKSFITCHSEQRFGPAVIRTCSGRRAHPDCLK